MTNQPLAMPHDENAERAVLGGCMVDNDRWPIAADALREEDFYRDGHRRIFATLGALSASGKPLDLLVIRDALRTSGELEAVGGAAYLAALMDGVPRSVNVEHYAAIVKGKATLRSLARAAQSILEECLNEDDEPRILLDRAAQRVFELEQGQSTRRGLESIEVALGKAAEQLAAVYEGRSVAGVSYGFTDLDRLSGGMGRGDLVILAARPSVGKSAFALHVGKSAALRGEPVAFFSLEMADAQIGARLLQSEGGVDTFRIRSGFATDADWNAITAAVQRLKSAPLYVADTPAATLLEIRAQCRRLKAERGLSLVIADYLQLLGGPRTENRQAQVAEFSRGLKALARDLDVPVLALAQFSREAEKDGKPQLRHLRESGAIEQDADVVLALYREERPRDAPDDGPIEVLILKQRNGPIGTVRVYFDPRLQRFADFTEEGA